MRGGQPWVRIVIGLVVSAAVVAAAGFVGFRLGQRTLDVRATDPVPASAVTVTATEGTLVDERPVSIDAVWHTGVEVFNRLTGTITWVAAASGTLFEIAAGKVLYLVDETPVVAFPGLIPAYREMGPGATGADVAQLQQYLVESGYEIAAADGTWRSSTTTAYRNWRVDNFLPARGNVPLGEVVFLADLPLRTTASNDFAVGRLVVDGELLFVALDGSPTLTLSLPSDSPMHVEAGAPLIIDFAGTPVDGVATDRQLRAEDGSRRIDIDVVGDSTLCVTWCEVVPTVGISAWAAIVVLKGPATGVIVPVGALRSGPSGAPVVVTADGVSKVVEVVLQVGGQAIVRGVQAGEVLVLATPPPP